MRKSSYFGVSKDRLGQWRFKLNGALSQPFETELDAARGRQAAVLLEAAGNKDLNGKPMLLSTYTEVNNA